EYLGRVHLEPVAPDAISGATSVPARARRLQSAASGVQGRQAHRARRVSVRDQMMLKPFALFGILAGGAGAVLAVPGDIARPLVATPLQQPQGQGQQVTIDMPRGSRPVMGIADFLGGDDAEMKTAAKTVADVLWKDLEFEEEFSMVSQSTAAGLPSA